MNGHTPGPWYINKISDTTVNGANVHVVAACGNHSDNSRDPTELHDELAANTRLIAAAPDLLFCLQQFMAALPKNRDWLDPDLERMAAGTIAKASNRRE